MKRRMANGIDLNATMGTIKDRQRQLHEKLEEKPQKDEKPQTEHKRYDVIGVFVDEEQ